MLTPERGLTTQTASGRGAGFEQKVGGFPRLDDLDIVFYLSIQVSLIVYLAVAGLVIHEGWHYVFGCLAGGDSFVSQWVWRLPREIDFHSPDQMSYRQAKLVAGGVYIFQRFCSPEFGCILFQ